MKNSIAIIIIVFLASNGFAQEKLCICFTKNTKYIEVKISNDSTRTSFSITKPGFETKEQKQNAIEKYKKRGPVQPPKFSIGYISGEFTQKKSLEDINCALMLSVDKFRQHDFAYPQGIGASSVFFIKKESESNFIVWKAFTVD